jgi:hypothetical protein
MKIVHESKEAFAALESPTDSDPLLPLLQGPAKSTASFRADGQGAVVGELVGITGDGRTPLITYKGQAGTAAIAARSTVDVQGAHVGRRVILLFEDADPERPIVMGILRDASISTLDPRPGTVEVDRDGERMIVEAKEQLVLQCGKARLTLTRAGKILIEGTYISSRSAGVNRLKGGSVQIN